MGRIQAAWHTPLDAMVELEALLFGRSEQSEVFDLPAYQEMLFLYQVARELHNSQPRASAFDDVDVLLPIGPASPPAAAVGEGSIVLRPEFNAGRRMMLDLDVDGSPNEGAVRVTGGLPSAKGADE
jgi:pilus assembly protein FimV